MATSPSIFRTASLLVGDRPGNVPVDFATIKKDGYSYVATQGINGVRIVGDPDTFTQQDWDTGLRPYPAYQDGLRDAGLKSIPWQKLYGGTQEQVQAEAKACASFVARFKPDGFQINPETEYKEDGFWRSKVYVDALLAQLARLGVDPNSVLWAIQPLGGAAVPAGQEVAPWVFGYDTPQWLRLPGCWCLPEAYWAPKGGIDGASPDYRPLNCADQWLNKQRWPAERFAFTLGWWNDRFASPEMYFADLALVKQRFPKWAGGFGIYLADQMPTDVIAAFGGGVAKGFAAKQEDAAPTPQPMPTPPPTPPPPSPAVLRGNIIAECDRYLSTRPGPEHLARLRIIRRIAQADNTDAKWTQIDDKMKALLDSVGLPT